MTPNDKFKFKNDAQCREVVLSTPIEGAKRFDTEYYVEGYAARYEPYLLYDDGEYGKVYERFEKGCFDETDFSDVIFQHDHAGHVYARTTNNSMIAEPDEIGLFFAADLGRTERSKNYYEDIKAEMVTKMSWRFKVGTYYVERSEGSKDVTIVHTKIPKVYDCSGVSIPANNSTSISARSFCDGVIAELVRSDTEEAEKRARIKTKIMCSI